MPYDPLDADSDPFRPPALSTMVGCLHCQEVYDSYQIEWRVFTLDNGDLHGFWCCPTEGCDGRGFCFDILPLDRDYVGEDGEKVWIEDADEEGDSTGNE